MGEPIRGAVVETDEGAVADHEPQTKSERRFGTNVKRSLRAAEGAFGTFYLG